MSFGENKKRGRACGYEQYCINNQTTRYKFIPEFLYSDSAITDNFAVDKTNCDYTNA